MLHVCFGYGRHVADKPAGYDFLPELDACRVDEISIEAAQPRLDLSVLDALPSKRIQLGVLDLRDTAIEPVDVGRGAHPLPASSTCRPSASSSPPTAAASTSAARWRWGKVAAMVAAARRVRAEL